MKDFSLDFNAKIFVQGLREIETQINTSCKKQKYFCHLQISEIAVHSFISVLTLWYLYLSDPF